MTPRALRRRLLAWYDRNCRDLPWRRGVDAWGVWVSEAMLQQTQVARVVPYFERFMARFPTPADLARADEEEALALWAGLGYYRRVRALREGAIAVCENHGGTVPADRDALLSLPGVGRYTAGAIASIAYGRREPVLDGNVRRVLSRLTADGGSGTSLDERLWSLAGRLADGPRPGDLNQALMELGARVCSPRRPACDACPLSRACLARAAGRPEGYPTPRRDAGRPRDVDVAVGVVRRGGRVLLVRRLDGSPLRGAWDLPAVEAPDGAALAGALRRRFGLEIRVGPVVATASHGVMRRRLRLTALDCRARRGRIAGRDDARWVDGARLDCEPVSGATLKLAADLGLVTALGYGRSQGGTQRSSASAVASGSGSIGPSKR